MKLQNKKTGGLATLVENEDCLTLKTDAGFHHYFSLAKLNEEWEDYEEPKEFWFIENDGDIDKETYDGDDYEERMIEIGNYFETREEAEQAVEKLKAWKRLKDKGFRFDGYDVAHNSNGDLCGQLFYNAGDYCIEDVEKELDLLFSGEDD